jgi:deferrochelatase/peroxidase EfeB
MQTRRCEFKPSDIQRIVAHDYYAKFGRHFVLRITDVVEARKFIDSLATKIVRANVERVDAKALLGEPECPVHIGFTFAGLKKLDVAGSYLDVFCDKAPAFAEGAWRRAAEFTTDTGPSGIRYWENPFKPDFAHVLISLYANDLKILDQRAKEWSDRKHGLDGWEYCFKAERLGEDEEVRMVHFEYRDGIATPQISGFPELRAGQPIHSRGELLLGYENDEGFNPWVLPFPQILPRHGMRHVCGIPDFFWNGSFGILRKMEQDVAEFEKFVNYWAVIYGAGNDIEAWKELIKAKMCGRWRNGRRVMPRDDIKTYYEEVKNKRLGEDSTLNGFDFEDDKKGHGCPYGAHIRRMNPRNDPVVPARRRPLIRRGMPYGKAAADGTQPDKCGLLGMFFCASIEDQFEFLLSQWGDMNPMGTNNRGNAKDPLIGNHQAADTIFDMPTADRSCHQLQGFRPFVKTRGMLYAFFPSVSMITAIANGKAIEDSYTEVAQEQA